MKKFRCKKTVAFEGLTSLAWEAQERGAHGTPLRPPDTTVGQQKGLTAARKQVEGIIEALGEVVEDAEVKLQQYL